MGATLFTGPLSGDATGLSGVPSITVDNIVANNISVAATLTYEDVKNVDSIGIVTARSGIRVLSWIWNLCSIWYCYCE